MMIVGGFHKLDCWNVGMLDRWNVGSLDFQQAQPNPIIEKSKNPINLSPP